MVIYGEYLFLENFITGVMILHLTRTFSGVRANFSRLVGGSVLCGLYSFIIFVPLGALPSLALKLAFSFGIVFLVFGQRKKRIYGKLVLLFYAVSFAMGGVTIGLMYFFQVNGISHNGAVYMGSVGYLVVTIAAAMGYLLLALVATWMKEQLFMRKISSCVRVALLGRTAELHGLLDTGNFLSEPITGKPVFLLAESVFEKVFSPEICGVLQGQKNPGKAAAALVDSELAGRIRLIPYRAVGTEEGLLLGIRPDYIEIIKEGEKDMREDVILGIYHGDFGTAGAGEPYGILLHCGAQKGGLVCHG